MKRALPVFLMLTVAALVLSLSFRGSAPPVHADNGKFIYFSPTTLLGGVSSVALPAGAGNPTPETITIDTRGAVALSLQWSCTQNVLPQAEVYVGDGVTIFRQNMSYAQSAHVIEQDFFTIANFQPFTDNGSSTINTTQLIYLPQRALSFHWANQTATAGTCTADAFEQY